MTPLPQHREAFRAEHFQFRDSLRPRPPLSVRKWAVEHRYLEKGVTAKPGKYSLDAAPYQAEIMDSFTEEDVQTVAMMLASRLGKTEMLNCLDGAIIDWAPMNILVVYPTIDSAVKWRKEFFNPMVRATPRLRDKVNIKLKSSDNTMLSLKYAGGTISAIGTNSPTGFRQIQAPCVRCDEIDAMEDGKEGDPIALAFKRADNYPNSIQVLSSTPTVKGHSRIESWMLQSDYRMWFCPCQKCGGFQVLRWSQVQWPENEPEKARYVCEFEGCRHAHDDAGRMEMIRNGQWRPTRPFTGVRGYWLNGINTLFPPKKGYATKMHQMVGEFLDAKHSDNPRETMRVWRNTFLAETYEIEGTHVDPGPLFARRENFGDVLHQNVAVITAGIDQQLDRIELQTVGWGVGEESWALEYDVIIGDPRKASTWQAVKAVLEREYQHPCGAVLKVSRGCADTGYAPSYDITVQFCNANQQFGLLPVKGIKGVGSPVLNPPARYGIARHRVWRVGTIPAKSIIYARLEQKVSDKDIGEGFVHFRNDRPPMFGPTYFKQLVSETVVQRFLAGTPYNEFLQNGPNEALDTFVYALAALRRVNKVDYPKILARMKEQVEEAKAPPKEKEPERPEPAWATAGVKW